MYLNWVRDGLWLDIQKATYTLGKDQDWAEQKKEYEDQQKTALKWLFFVCSQNIDFSSICDTMVGGGELCKSFSLLSGSSWPSKGSRRFSIDGSSGVLRARCSHASAISSGCRNPASGANPAPQLRLGERVSTFIEPEPFFWYILLTCACSSAG